VRAILKVVTKATRV